MTPEELERAQFSSVWVRITSIVGSAPTPTAAFAMPGVVAILGTAIAASAAAVGSEPPAAIGASSAQPPATEPPAATAEPPPEPPAAAVPSSADPAAVAEPSEEEEEEDDDEHCEEDCYGDGELDPNDPNNVAEEEEEDDDDDDDAAHGAISEGGEVRSWSKRLAGLSDPATAVKTFKEKHSLIVANAKPDGHCGFMSVALQPAKQPRSIPTMPAQIKTLRVAVANIIEQKTHRSRLAFLLTEADGQGDDAKGTVLTMRAKEHRKANTPVGLSHTATPAASGSTTSMPRRSRRSSSARSSSPTTRRATRARSRRCPIPPCLTSRSARSSCPRTPPSAPFCSTETRTTARLPVPRSARSPSNARCARLALHTPRASRRAPPLPRSQWPVTAAHCHKATPHCPQAAREAWA